MACAIPAAIANAVFDATGARLRSVPLTSDKVKAALAATPQRG
jgi:CO/xanthine dehydrogenase Mo-binding subunit